MGINCSLDVLRRDRARRRELGEEALAAVRKKAVFWLGQVGGEEALELFEEILLKKKK